VSVRSSRTPWRTVRRQDPGPAWSVPGLVVLCCCPQRPVGGPSQTPSPRFGHHRALSLLDPTRSGRYAPSGRRRWSSAVVATAGVISRSCRNRHRHRLAVLLFFRRTGGPTARARPGAELEGGTARRTPRAETSCIVVFVGRHPLLPPTAAVRNQVRAWCGTSPDWWCASRGGHRHRRHAGRC